VPLLGKAAAGIPIAAARHHDADMEITREMAGDRDPADLFAVYVQGDSMTGAGILNEDRVVSIRTEAARPGDIVVAQLLGPSRRSLSSDSR
jgi:repressor LexA